MIAGGKRNTLDASGGIFRSKRNTLQTWTKQLLRPRSSVVFDIFNIHVSWPRVSCEHRTCARATLLHLGVLDGSCCGAKQFLYPSRNTLGPLCMSDCSRFCAVQILTSLAQPSRQFVRVGLLSWSLSFKSLHEKILRRPC